MANKIVFDSSALIMLFAKELGYESIRKHMKYAIISSVNIAEVYKYCIEVQNLTEDDCRNLIKLSGCCAPGILVHPCARREVHFILTFLLHFVILHFKFRYKVFSIRIAF
jgi:hypothetical protein